MRIRRAILHDNTETIVALSNNEWISLQPLLQENNISTSSVIPFLNFYQENKDLIVRYIENNRSPADIKNFLPPLKPISLRGFMLWEKHFMAAKRGLIALAKPKLFKAIKWLMDPNKKSALLRPQPMFYKVPIYYMGNHLQAYFHSQEVSYPSYTKWLDFEAEIGLIVTKQVRNVQDDSIAIESIGGALIVNDFSARDMQIKEFKESLFGPVVKAKNFATGFSFDVITADEVLPIFDKLKAKVFINDKLIVEGTTYNHQHNPIDMVKYASLEETLYPGEILSTGTIPGCCAVEHYPEENFFLRKGDKIKIEITHIGKLENVII